MTVMGQLIDWQRGRRRWYTIEGQPSYGTDIVTVVLVERVDLPHLTVTQDSNGPDALERAVTLALWRWEKGDFDKGSDLYEECGEQVHVRGDPDHKCRRRKGHSGIHASGVDEVAEPEKASYVECGKPLQGRQYTPGTLCRRRAGHPNGCGELPDQDDDGGFGNG